MIHLISPPNGKALSRVPMRPPAFAMLPRSDATSLPDSGRLLRRDIDFGGVLGSADLPASAKQEIGCAPHDKLGFVAKPELA